MQSRWQDKDAKAFIERANAQGDDPELGLRVYSSRLIGQDPDLVLHGGGNTSVKIGRGGADAIIHIKGSGWDLDSIEAPGLPAVRLAPLLAARDAEQLSDPDMVALLRQNLLDPGAPNPSVEALLHAFLPFAYVDHTHASAVLALANQSNMEVVVERLYGGRLAFVPYVMPGYDLSIEADRIFRANPNCEGLWLANHGLFTFADDARTSYERMIAFASVAEAALKDAGAALPPPTLSDSNNAPQALIERLRAVLMRDAGPFSEDAVCDFRSTSAIRTYVGRVDLEDLSARGTATPDHVIRIKPFPMIIAADASEANVRSALDGYKDHYRAYFERNAARAPEPKTILDPLPRVVLVRGVGIIGLGATSKAARIAADLVEQTARIVLAAEAYGRFTPIGEADLFDMEYWSLEQAKLKTPSADAHKAANA